MLHRISNGLYQFLCHIITRRQWLRLTTSPNNRLYTIKANSSIQKLVINMLELLRKIQMVVLASGCNSTPHFGKVLLHIRKTCSDPITNHFRRFLIRIIFINTEKLSDYHSSLFPIYHKHIQKNPFIII